MVVEARALAESLESYARGRGVDLVGVADRAPAQDFASLIGGDFLREFPRALSLAIHISNSVVERLVHREDPKQHLTSTYSYRAHGAQVGAVLDRVVTGLVGQLEKEGWQAYPVFPGRADDEAQEGCLSQKVASHLSGLGWIGKSCLLVSPSFGPRLRLATVLTDAPLLRDNPGRTAAAPARSALIFIRRGPSRGAPSGRRSLARFMVMNKLKCHGRFSPIIALIPLAPFSLWEKGGIMARAEP